MNLWEALRFLFVDLKLGLKDAQVEISYTDYRIGIRIKDKNYWVKAHYSKGGEKVFDIDEVRDYETPFVDFTHRIHLTKESTNIAVVKDLTDKDVLQYFLEMEKEQ